MSIGTFEVMVSGIEYSVGFSHTEYRPGRIHGPPDLCYEAEGGETELTRVVNYGQVSWYGFLRALAVHLTAEWGDVYSVSEAETWLTEEVEDYVSDRRNWEDDPRA